MCIRESSGQESNIAISDMLLSPKFTVVHGQCGLVMSLLILLIHGAYGAYVMGKHITITALSTGKTELPTKSFFPHIYDILG